MIAFSAGRLDTLVRIERPIADTSFRGAGSGSWALVDEAWACIVDALPSRGEQAGIATTLTRPARVWLRYREDIDASMRLVAGTRIMQITGGPAVIGRRVGIELAVAEYLPAGNPA